MWRMALLIRHHCGERKNYVGHRCSNIKMCDNDKIQPKSQTVLVFELIFQKYCEASDN